MEGDDELRSFKLQTEKETVVVSSALSILMRGSLQVNVNDIPVLSE